MASKPKKDENPPSMTRAEAEEVFTTCVALVSVLGGDLKKMCRGRGMPEEYIKEFVEANSKSEVYDQFFKVHTDTGEINLSEKEIITKLQNFEIYCRVDEKGDKWIKMPAKKIPTTVELSLCKELESKYGYRYL